MKDAKELLDLIFEAHGGLEKWKEFNTLKAHVTMGGITWGVKGHEGAMKDIHFTANMHAPIDSWRPFSEPNLHTSFDGKDIFLLNAEGQKVEELKDARKSFDGHDIMTPWTRLQLAYFTSYASWNYLTTPFIFSQPGFHFLEMDTWVENGETLRRLQVIFPDHIPTHSKRQVFYISADGLMKRHDYWPEVMGNNSATHYYSEYREVKGIKSPGKHHIVPLDDATNLPIEEPVLVTIDVLSIDYL